MSGLSQLVLLLLHLLCPPLLVGFRVLDQATNKAVYDVSTDGYFAPDANGNPVGYFQPYATGFVGRFGDPNNFQRERTNEGAQESPEQELLLEGSEPRQICPGMVGPFSDGNYYCTAREFGYCDRRSGSCFCNMGYGSIDCSECTGTHFRQDGQFLCLPRRLCVNDCSGAGTCNFYSGQCTCLPHRTGTSCEIHLCSRYDELCEACDTTQCLRCRSGYYLTGLAYPNVCSTCYDFDQRCAGCTKEVGCTTCADPLLTSIRRSGYRASDRRLPLEEDTRELSLNLPFGTKSPDAFAEAEQYVVAPGYSKQRPLNAKSQSCTQGLRNDESWNCTLKLQSHTVCGHKGVFKFIYPNYIVPEKQGYFPITISRSGGGYGNVTISYFIRHFTTSDADMVATASYTTLQKLTFEEGVVERTFLVKILDDNLVEEDETFQVILEVPEGGGSVGPQFRTNVTILDDDLGLLSPSKTMILTKNVSVVSGVTFTALVQAAYPTSQNMTTGGETLFSLLENFYDKWANPGTPSGSQRHTLRAQCPVTDNADGSGRYTVKCKAIAEQGGYQLRVYHAFPGGLTGQYYYDSFFNNLAFSRLDANVNFTWGQGKLVTHGTDFVTIRWSGIVKAAYTGTHQFYVEADDNARLWIDGDLVLDHWQERYATLEPSRSVFLTLGSLYEIVLEYREITLEANCRLMWSYGSVKMTVITKEFLYALFPIGDPINVQVSSAQTEPTTTECTGAGLSVGQALQEATFNVCPRDVHLNLRDDDDAKRLSIEYFAATLKFKNDTSPTGLIYNGDGGSVYKNGDAYRQEYIQVPLTYDFGMHCFTGRYTPLRAGIYSLDVTYQQQAFGTAYRVAGGPFTVNVSPSTTFGPYSVISNLPNPTNAVAGLCYTFFIEARDGSRNRRWVGGDNFVVYTYQVDYAHSTPGTAQNTGNGAPTGQPSGSPTTAPTKRGNTNPSHQRSSPVLETYQNVIRYGTVVDYGNGTYAATMCPVLQGTHELHILLNGQGVSNQPFRIIDRWYSYWDAQGGSRFQGMYVDKSPYIFIVQHGSAQGQTTTAEGAGLATATVNVPANILVTIRDSWDNVLRTSNLLATLTCTIAGVPQANIKLWNYGNGSYTVTYTPVQSGPNQISIFIDNFHISGSPFTVPVTDGQASEVYSATLVPSVGLAGMALYFQVYAYDVLGNRKTTNTDAYTYSASSSSGGGTLAGALSPCPIYPDPSHPVCDPYDTALGHYWGFYIPQSTGTWQLTVYLGSAPATRKKLVLGAPFVQTISPGSPMAENTDINGPLYDNVAGTTAVFSLLLRDAFKNALISGGNAVEVVLLGVAVEWGTIQPWGATPGLPNAYNYRGFYQGYPNVYADVIDNMDGTYLVTHAATMAGQYVMRFSVAQAGLNASYFNNTGFGYLTDRRFFSQQWAETLGGVAQNLGTTISWTGDVGGSHGFGSANKSGDLGAGSYYGFFRSRVETTVNLNLTFGNGLTGLSVSDRSLRETRSAFPRADKFREEYWSVRYTGMITPSVAETFLFTVLCDASSDVRLYIGGVGTALNGSAPGSLVINMTSTHAANTGSYNFTDSNSRELVLEYAHYMGEAFLQLQWQSPSTPLAVVPASAFTHWRNMSHFNTTIHPAPLSPRTSTAVGAALTTATVAQHASFVVYARDRFGNLMQKGGDVPSAVAFGRDGALFRGAVTDYGNSTYLVEYVPTVAGEYLLYVTVGCCPPHPNVGQASEISMSADLMIQGSPFLLTVMPAEVEVTRTVAAGPGALGGVAGQQQGMFLLYRDVFNNPTTLGITSVSMSAGTIFSTALSGTTISSTADVRSTTVGYAGAALAFDRLGRPIAALPAVKLVFVDVITGNYILPTYFSGDLGVTAAAVNATVAYTMTRAGLYSMHVMLAASVLVSKLARNNADAYDHPSLAPSASPTLQPLKPPTGQPTGQPSRQPTVQPTGQPSGQPTRRPSGQPTVQPTGHPTNLKPSSTPAPSYFPLAQFSPIQTPPGNLVDPNPSAVAAFEGAGFTDIVGSPFSITIFPGRAVASTTLCRGPGLRQGATNQAVTFEIRLRDEFQNKLITGGNKLFVRLVGVRGAGVSARGGGPNGLGSTATGGGAVVIPSCVDQLNGKYLCRYTALFVGQHQLVVRLLTSSPSGPGGGGLSASYFSSVSPFPTNFTSTSAGEGRAGVVNIPAAEPDYRRVDPLIALSWPDGNIVPAYEAPDAAAAFTVPLKSVGQSVSWTGYVVTPRSDIYTFHVAATRMSVSIWVDGRLVFDSATGIQTPLTLASEAAYEIQIDAKVDASSVGPVAIELRWFTPTVKEALVPTFFLYESGQDVLSSPFPIIVGGPIPSVH